MAVTLCDGGVRSHRRREKVHGIFSVLCTGQLLVTLHPSSCADHRRSQRQLNLDIMGIWILLGLIFFLPLVMFIGKVSVNLWAELD